MYSGSQGIRKNLENYNKKENNKEEQQKNQEKIDSKKE